MYITTVVHTFLSIIYLLRVYIYLLYCRWALLGPQWRGRSWSTSRSARTWARWEMPAVHESEVVSAYCMPSSNVRVSQPKFGLKKFVWISIFTRDVADSIWLTWKNFNIFGNSLNLAWHCRGMWRNLRAKLILCMVRPSFAEINPVVYIDSTSMNENFLRLARRGQF